MKIGIFGGTFNPIHFGHLRPIEEVRENFNLNKILFVLAKNPPHKFSKNILPANVRFEILKIALEDNPYFFSSDIEIKRKGKSYTYDTLIEIKEIHKNDEIFLIIGKDSFYDLKTWYKWKEILKLVDIIVLNRKISKRSYEEENYMETLGYKKINNSIYENESKRKVYLFENSIIEVSSSKIRENFKKGLSNRYLIPEKALKFIVENKFY